MFSDMVKYKQSERVKHLENRFEFQLREQIKNSKKFQKGVDKRLKVWYNTKCQETNEKKRTN